MEEKGPGLRSRIIEALDSTIMPDLKSTVTDDFWMTPEDFKSNYRSMHGAGFSIASVFSQSAWFCYHNRDPHIPKVEQAWCRNTRQAQLKKILLLRGNDRGI